MAKASKNILLAFCILVIAVATYFSYRYSLKKSSMKTAATTGQMTPNSTSSAYTDPSFGKGTQILAPSGMLAAGFSNLIIYPGSTIIYSYNRDFSAYTQLTTALSSADTVADITAYYLKYFQNDRYSLIKDGSKDTPATIDFISPDGKTRAHLQVNPVSAANNTITIIFLVQK